MVPVKLLPLPMSLFSVVNFDYMTGNLSSSYNWNVTKGLVGYAGKRKNQEKSRQTIQFLHASPGLHFIASEFCTAFEESKNTAKIVILTPAAALQRASLQSVSKRSLP
jgi:hypothetical protein